MTHIKRALFASLCYVMALAATGAEVSLAETAVRSSGAHDIQLVASTAKGSRNAVDRLSVFVGSTFQSSLHLEFERWLGRKVNFATANLDGRYWRAMWGSCVGQFSRDGKGAPRLGAFSRLTHPTVVLTVGVNNGADSETWEKMRGKGPEFDSLRRTALTEVAEGAKDDIYRRCAKLIVEAGHGNAVIRLGHEADIGYPWSMSGGNWEFYKKAWRHVREVMLSVEGADFRFDYSLNGLAHHIPPGSEKTMMELGYPGDDVVDIVGQDIYDRVPWEAIEDRLSRTQAFAASRGKQFSVPEWGLSKNGDNPAYIQNMYDWLSSLPGSGPGSLAYHGYFNGLAESKLDQYPNAQERFKQLFGAQQ